MPVSLLFGASCYHLLLLRLASATSYSSDIGVSCRDSNGSEADVSCLSIQSNPGRHSLVTVAIAIGMIEALMFPPGVQPQEVTVAPATPSDMFQSLGKCVVLTPVQPPTIRSIQLPAELPVTTVLLSISSVQDVKANIFIGQASLTYKEGIIDFVNIAKGQQSLQDMLAWWTPLSSKEVAEYFALRCPQTSSWRGNSSTPPARFLRFQYDPIIVAPRTVVDSFAAVGGSSLPPSKPTAGSQASKSFISHPIAYGAISLFLATRIQICAGSPLSRATNSTPFFETPALLLTLISIGELIGLVSSDGSVTVIHADLTQSNDILRVLANTLVPTVIRGMTQVDESALTGESLPVDKGPGAPLTPGTRNDESCSGAGGEHQSLKSVHSWHVYRRLGFPSKIWRIALPAGLSPVILVVAITVFVVWVARTQRELQPRGVGSSTVYDCGSGCIVPMCYRTRTDGNCDSGYLTLGEMALRHISRQGTVETILSLVSKSSHPVTRSIAKYLHATYSNVKIYLDKVQPILGKGLEVTTSDGVRIRGGSPSWLGLQADPLYSTRMTKALSMFAVTFDGELVAFFGLTDLPRPSADVAPVAHALAAQLGVPPEFAHVQELQAPRGRVMFVGDGANDTPALAAADVSVAMGGGTDVARDTAHIVFLAPDPERALGGRCGGSTSIVRLQLVCCSPRGGRVCTRSDCAGVRGLRRDGCLGEYPARAYPHAAVFSFALSRGAGSCVGVRDLSL
ncbi:hypothetical protein EDB84DRAFT_1435253 [Lactarius hengduanensis]|nr:hypothetical protein EDB84DRAFT_1435253 [Lactarius hengduanensis]